MHRGNNLIMTSTGTESGAPYDHDHWWYSIQNRATLLKRLEKGLYYGNWLYSVVHNFSFQESSQLKFKIDFQPNTKTRARKAKFNELSQLAAGNHLRFSMPTLYQLVPISYFLFFSQTEKSIPVWSTGKLSTRITATVPYLHDKVAVHD